MVSFSVSHTCKNSEEHNNKEEVSNEIWNIIDTSGSELLHKYNSVPVWIWENQVQNDLTKESGIESCDIIDFKTFILFLSNLVISSSFSSLIRQIEFISSVLLTYNISMLGIAQIHSLELCCSLL